MEATIRGGVRILIDEQDLPLVLAYSWYAVTTDPESGSRYVMRRNAIGKTRYLHREIMEASKGEEVDHRDGDTLNMQRANLRKASRSQQNQNQGMNRRNTSGYKGVSWHRHKRRWAASIQDNRKQYFLGYFDDPVEAARRYDQAAQERFGEFARLNFPVK